jgi:hypothetical protein
MAILSYEIFPVAGSLLPLSRFVFGRWSVDIFPGSCALRARAVSAGNARVVDRVSYLFYNQQLKLIYGRRRNRDSLGH